VNVFEDNWHGMVYDDSGHRVSNCCLAFNSSDCYIYLCTH